MADASTVSNERRNPPACRGLRLTVAAGPNAGRTAVVAHEKAVIGRSEQADLCVSDPRVSSFHVEVYAAPDGVAIVDLESTNGTYYAGARLYRAAPPNTRTLLRVAVPTQRLAIFCWSSAPPLP